MVFDTHTFGHELGEELFHERTRVLSEFLETQRCSTDGTTYKEKIGYLLRSGESRLIVNVLDLKTYNPSYSDGILRFPLDYMPAFDKALKLIIDSVYEPHLPYVDINKVFFHVGLDGSFGDSSTNPRGLSSRFISKMVCVEGIVTSCFLVRPKLVRSVHYVEKRNVFVAKTYTDSTMGGDSMPTSTAYPTEDFEGNKLCTEYGFCTYRDTQKIIMQEVPEKAPPGHLPRSVEVLLMDDLVDKLKPGDRTCVVGIYKSMASIVNGQTPLYFKTLLIANHIKKMNKDAFQPVLTDIDIKNIKDVSGKTNCFELLSRSIAPSIYGHKFIKKAVLLMLLGGTEHDLENTHIRGDINILLVGDPSTAKSQILRFIMNIAPLAIATTGKGSSGVGLTAVVSIDKETKDRRLEAGAMVLADRGVVCIDEFDKMSSSDRVAIHEVMEQQTVTIAKAGIHMSLNARCSIIAAANPMWSQYRETATPQENIRLPVSLLSRFDLLFVVLDLIDEKIDRQISRHVTHMHRCVFEEDYFGHAEEYYEDSRERIDVPIYQKFQFFEDDEKDSIDNTDYLTIGFMKKYIHYARVRMKPILTQSAIELIKKLYCDFREKSCDSTTYAFRVTPRTLETIIRLSTAHAKARLSHYVEDRDVVVAEELLKYYLYREMHKDNQKRRKTVEESMKGLDIGDKENDEFSFSANPPDSKIDSRKSRLSKLVEREDDASVVERVKNSLIDIRNDNPNDTSFELSSLVKVVNASEDGNSIDTDTIEHVLKSMEKDNLIMYREKTIFLL